MKKQFKGIVFLGLFLMFLPDFGFAENRYVSDKLKVTVRSGPSTEYKILDIAESGDRVEVLESGVDWTLVKLASGREGYITSRYLVSGPTHAIRFEQLQVKYKALTELMATVFEDNTQLREENKNLKAVLENTENLLNKEKKPQPQVPAGSATGFFVTPTGYAITNHHVVVNCKRLTLRIEGEKREARIIAEDEANDLALIKISGAKCAFVKFRGQRRSELGESIMIAGYPLKGLLASDLNVTGGTISALAGIGDDPRFLQITAPVQPGNSGGPLLDTCGRVLGVVVGKLDTAKAFRITGDIPQNVNFAVKGVILRTFLDINGVDYEVAPSKLSKPPNVIAREAQNHTFSIDCWR